MNPDFLTLEEVLEIHSTQLTRFGGAAGVRDIGLLESALSQPQASFGGQYVHEDLFEMASAYLFHVVSNHPFVDGNKRAGLLSALVFLDINGIEINDQGDTLYNLTIKVASGNSNKLEISEVLRRLAGPSRERP
ncbi:MAG: type II toxin-antitoxin system death-on-curing family toxin [Burkholderiaceae bacterium]|nr:type II toxin-antitoxin system death-on-curing family toxin [Burkholderiaceae bacterium]